MDVSYGYSRYRDTGFVKLKFSAFSHDLMDNEAGYPHKLNLKLMDVQLKYYPSPENFDFSVAFLSLSALPYFDRFSNKLSFSSMLGYYYDKENYSGARSKGLEFKNNFGLTLPLGKMADFSALIKADAEANNSSNGYYLGTGALGRLVINWDTSLKTAIEYHYEVGTDGHYAKSDYLTAAQSVYLSKNLSLFGNYKYKFRDDAYIFDAGLSLYF
ncbi:hypothetical protein AAIR98_000202 [Elusimicrobium simillimum]|uniref:DUF7840 domain-containing protein n=1 Tax=Elusimicrobium simillimum TaxID=3143438 RepID=UPI003C6ED401